MKTLSVVGELPLNKVIKCNRSSGLLDEHVVVRALELAVQAELNDSGRDQIPGMLERAQREADIIVATARAEARSIREAAYAEGYSAGSQDAVDRTQMLIDRLSKDISDAAEERQAVLDTVEPELLKLCTELVEKIVRHEIKTDPRIVLRVIRSCLRRIKDSQEVRIRVNPSELEAVRAQREELFRLADGLRGISIVDDRRVSAGGCIIETATGDFDATVETQLERINNKLGDTYDNACNTCNTGSDQIPESNQQG